MFLLSLLFRQLLKSNYDDTVLGDQVVHRFQQISLGFKQSNVDQARKSFSSVTAKPNSTVAAIVAESRRNKFFKSLLPSQATLLVVPAVLMDHWEVNIFIGFMIYIVSSLMTLG